MGRTRRAQAVWCVVVQLTQQFPDCVVPKAPRFHERAEGSCVGENEAGARDTSSPQAEWGTRQLMKGDE